MKVSVARPDELGASELEAWRSMQRTSAEFDNAFLSPGFALAAGRVRPGARVAVLEEGGDVVGFFPFEQGRFGIGRPIAAGIADLQAVVHAPGFEWRNEELLKGCQLAVWEFDHLVASQLALVGDNITSHPSPVMDVSDGYDRYIDARRQVSKVVRTTLSKERKLSREVDSLRFELDSRDEDALQVLMRWKSAQYRRTGRRDRFAVGWIARVVVDLFETRSLGCTGLLSVLYSGERVLAAHMGLRCDSVLSCWFPAYDVHLGRYSPGLVLHLKMAEVGASAGLRCLDLGKGDEEYKQSLKTGDGTVGEGWIERRSAVALVRRMQRMPGRLAFGVVSRHPRLRRGARRVLREIGTFRGSV